MTTETRMAVEFEDLVDDVMRGAPETIRVFLEFRMGCVGCPIACYHTVDDACREHGANRDAFLDALRSVGVSAIASAAVRSRREQSRPARTIYAARAARCV